VNLVSSRLVTSMLVQRRTNLIAQVWDYSGQALAKPSGLPDLFFGHTNGRGHKGAIAHLGIVAHLDTFIEY
jgi:hypothetical protein